MRYINCIIIIIIITMSSPKLCLSDSLENEEKEQRNDDSIKYLTKAELVEQMVRSGSIQAPKFTFFFANHSI